MDRTLVKGIVAGAAAGMVGTWAARRFYMMARESARERSMAPFLIGAGIGIGYGAYAMRREAPLFARVPMGAAMWLGAPEKTAAPPKGGADLPEKARNIALRMAAGGLKKVAEKALFA